MAEFKDSVGGIESEWIKVEYKALVKELEQYNKDMPNVAVRLMRAVNKEAIKEIKKEAKSRGYKSKKAMPYGEAGYTKTIKGYANKNYTGKIMVTKNAYWWTFIEYGANIQPRGKYLTFKIGGKWYKSTGFILPARPIIRPNAERIWGTDRASKIMEVQMQKEIAKKFKK